MVQLLVPSAAFRAASSPAVGNRINESYSPFFSPERLWAIAPETAKAPAWPKLLVGSRARTNASAEGYVETLVVWDQDTRAKRNRQSQRTPGAQAQVLTGR